MILRGLRPTTCQLNPLGFFKADRAGFGDWLVTNINSSITCGAKGGNGLAPFEKAFVGPRGVEQLPSGISSAFWGERCSSVRWHLAFRGSWMRDYPDPFITTQRYPFQPQPTHYLGAM